MGFRANFCYFAPIFGKILSNAENDQDLGAWSAPTRPNFLRPVCAVNDQAGRQTTRSGHTGGTKTKFGDQTIAADRIATFQISSLKLSLQIL